MFFPDQSLEKTRHISRQHRESNLFIKLKIEINQISFDTLRISTIYILELHSNWQKFKNFVSLLHGAIVDFQEFLFLYTYLHRNRTKSL